MVLTDPIADMLTRIRNGGRARHESVEIPVSKMKMRLAEILQKEGYVSSAEIVNGVPYNHIRVGLKYIGPKTPLISEIKRISKPGCRIYATSEDVQSWKGAITTTILSTSKGVMTDSEARDLNVGGEIIARIQ